MSNAKKFIESQEELIKQYHVDPETIATLLDQKRHHLSQIEMIDNAVNCLRILCTHDYKPDEFTPHFTIHRCIHCLNELKV
jgi:hypothetical protein